MDFNIISPKTTDELLKAIEKNQDTNFRFGAGYTDLLLELKAQKEEGLLIVNLAKLDDERFSLIEESGRGLRIGSLATVNEILYNKTVARKFSVLHEAANSLASTQIREVATIGGNICTASPSGDLSCALVALKAECEILNSEGDIRAVAIEDFFTGVRKTVLAKNEILRSVLIPSNDSKKFHSGFIKIGERNSMEIAIVALAYHFQKDENEKLISSGIAIGAVAPTIKFTTSACDFLLGKKLSELTEGDKKAFANMVMQYASPISDIRASTWYRSEVLFNISKSVLEKI